MSDQFYKLYLAEHSNRTNRRLHFIGTSAVPILLILAIVMQRWEVIIAAPVIAYGMAWTGHFFCEHNKPATFKHPWLSLKSDWKMWWEMLTGRITF